MPNVDDVYASMVGNMIEALEAVEDEYRPGSYCERLYQRAVEARTRLCGRLGVNEDTDLEMIFDCLSDITAFLCYKMYEYGEKFAQK